MLINLLYKSKTYPYQRALLKHSDIKLKDKITTIIDPVKSRYWNILLKSNEKFVKVREKCNIDTLEHLRHMDYDGSTKGCGCYICTLKNEKYLLEVQLSNDRTVVSIISKIKSLQSTAVGREVLLEMYGRKFCDNVYLNNVVNRLIYATTCSVEAKKKEMAFVNNLIGTLQERIIKNTERILEIKKGIEKLSQLTMLPVWKRDKLNYSQIKKLQEGNKKIILRTLPEYEQSLSDFLDSISAYKPEDKLELMSLVEKKQKDKALTIIGRYNDMGDKLLGITLKLLKLDENAFKYIKDNNMRTFAEYYHACCKDLFLK